VTFKEPTLETGGSNTIQTDSKVTSSNLSVKQDPVDDLLEKQDGLIKRDKDQKLYVVCHEVYYIMTRQMINK
jgi:hypothetical protein